MMISPKKNGQTFRITFDWVRDEYVAHHGFLLGNGYIEREWDLTLRPEKPAVPVVSPFVWKLRSRDETVPKASYPESLTGGVAASADTEKAGGSGEPMNDNEKGD